MRSVLAKNQAIRPKSSKAWEVMQNIYYKIIIFIHTKKFILMYIFINFIKIILLLFFIKFIKICIKIFH